jgi:hypothetical protein
MPHERIVCPIDREAMQQFWDAALERFKAYVESAEANAQRVPTHFDVRHPSDWAEGEK